MNSNKLLEKFIKAVIDTVTNHLKHVEDQQTEQRWSDLVCNGIVSTTPMTTAALAMILDVTDHQQSLQMGTLIQVLCEELPVLRNYYEMKFNQKSFHVKRLVTSSNAKLLSRIRSTQKDDGKSKKVQTTLTQSSITTKGLGDTKSSITTKGLGDTNTSPRDDKLTLLIQENMDHFEASSPTKTKILQDIVEASDDTESEVNVLDRSILDMEKEEEMVEDEGFVQPKKSVPANMWYQQKYQSSNNEAKTSTNSFAIMTDDIATDLDLESPAKDDTTTGKQVSAKEDDSGISYSSTKSTTPKAITHTITITPDLYDTLMDIIGAGLNERLSEELLTEWIEGRIKYVAGDMLGEINTKMHKFIDKDLNKMSQAIKTCQID